MLTEGDSMGSTKYTLKQIKEMIADEVEAATGKRPSNRFRFRDLIALQYVTRELHAKVKTTPDILLGASIHRSAQRLLKKLQ